MIAAGQVQSRSAKVVRGHMRENARLLAPDVELGNVRSRKASTPRGVHQLHQLLRLRISERLSKNRVDHRKDSSVHAMPTAITRTADDGETGSLRQGSQRKARIAPKIFEPRNRPVPPYRLACRARVPNFQPRPGAGPLPHSIPNPRRAPNFRASPPGPSFAGPGVRGGNFFFSPKISFFSKGGGASFHPCAFSIFCKRISSRIHFFDLPIFLSGALVKRVRGLTRSEP